MEFYSPDTWLEALEVRAAHPEAVPIFGGTDVMVDLNFDRERPGAVLDLAGPRAGEWDDDEGLLRVGGGVTVHEDNRRARRRAAGVGDGFADGRIAPDPEPRHRGRQPGHRLSGRRRCHPLYASDAEWSSPSTAAPGEIPVAEFITGPKRNALRPDELAAAFHIPKAEGPQQYSKIRTATRW